MENSKISVLFWLSVQMARLGAKPIAEFLPLAFSLQKKCFKADGILATAATHGNNKASFHG